MADRRGLQIIGWTFGGVAIALSLIATIVVRDAIASGAEALEQRPIAVAAVASSSVR